MAMAKYEHAPEGGPLEGFLGVLLSTRNDQLQILAAVYSLILPNPA